MKETRPVYSSKITCEITTTNKNYDEYAIYIFHYDYVGYREVVVYRHNLTAFISSLPSKDPDILISALFAFQSWLLNNDIAMEKIVSNRKYWY